MRGFIALSGCGQSTGASSGLRELDASWPTLMRKISRKSPPLLICTAVATRYSMIPVGAASKMLSKFWPSPAGGGSILKIRLLELAQHLAQFHQHAPHEVFLRLIAQTFGDDLVQCLPGLRQ